MKKSFPISEEIHPGKESQEIDSTILKYEDNLKLSEVKLKEKQVLEENNELTKSGIEFNQSSFVKTHFLSPSKKMKIEKKLLNKSQGNSKH
jgi:hypothetical protein